MFNEGTMQVLLAAVSFSGVAGLTNMPEKSHGWTHTFQAGRDPFNGTEIVYLATHQGKLYAGVGYRMNPSHHLLEIIRQDYPNGPWLLDGRPSQGSVSPEVLKEIIWTHGAAGTELNPPVVRLIVTYHLQYGNEGRCYMAVKQGDSPPSWTEMRYYAEKPWRKNHFGAQAAHMHRDAVTGIQHLFVTAGKPGIIKGTYSPGNVNSVKFDRIPEGGIFPVRPLGLAVVGGKLYASVGSLIYRRHDGEDATWKEVFGMSDHDSTAVDEEMGGIRGLSMIPNQQMGESIYFSWCPGGTSQGCMVRVDIDGDSYTYNQEQCVADVMKTDVLQGASVQHSLANYNFATWVSGAHGGSLHLIGFQISLFWRSSPKYPITQVQRLHENSHTGFYAGAGFLIRRNSQSYEARVPGGPQSCDEVQPLVAVRSIVNSPFEADKNAVYMGGYDCNRLESSDSAWIMGGTPAVVHEESVSYANMVCTTTTSTTVTTSQTLACPICGHLSREARWIDMSYVSVWNSSGMALDTAHMIDGNPDTWGGAQNFILDLGMDHFLSAIKVEFKDCPCSAPKSFQIQASLDGLMWSTPLQPSLALHDEHVQVTFDTNLTARLIGFHLNGMSTNDRISIWEIHFLGFKEYYLPPYELAESRIALEAHGHTFNCKEAESHANRASSTYNCVTAQLYWWRRCCTPATEPPSTTRAPPTTTWTSHTPTHTSTSSRVQQVVKTVSPAAAMLAKIVRKTSTSPINSDKLRSTVTSSLTSSSSTSTSTSTTTTTSSVSTQPALNASSSMQSLSLPVAAVYTVTTSPTTQRIGSVDEKGLESTWESLSMSTTIQRPTAASQASASVTVPPVLVTVNRGAITRTKQVDAANTEPDADLWSSVAVGCIVLVVIGAGTVVMFFRLRRTRPLSLPTPQSQDDRAELPELAATTPDVLREATETFQHSITPRTPLRSRTPRHQ